MRRRSRTSIGLFAIAVALGSAAYAVQRSSEDVSLSSEDRELLDKLDPDDRAVVAADIEPARACIAKFARADGAEDAKRDLASGKFRLLTGFTYTTAIIGSVPGVARCRVPSAPSSKVDGVFANLPEAGWDQDHVLSIRGACHKAARRYGAAYNHRMIASRPKNFRRACPTGRVIDEVFG